MNTIEFSKLCKSESKKNTKSKKKIEILYALLNIKGLLDDISDEEFNNILKSSK